MNFLYLFTAPKFRDAHNLRGATKSCLDIDSVLISRTRYSEASPKQTPTPYIKSTHERLSLSSRAKSYPCAQLPHNFNGVLYCHLSLSPRQIDARHLRRARTCTLPYYPMKPIPLHSTIQFDLRWNRKNRWIRCPD